MQLRPFQKQAIDLLSAPVGHLICIAPTGSGKSLIYEHLCTQKHYRTLLITPLVALGRQQKIHLEAQGLRVSRGLPEFQKANYSSDIWILSPEALLFPETLRAIRIHSPDLLVVDECHCLGEWGENFRPTFNLIPNLIPNFNLHRSLWLTATLSQSDLKRTLQLLPTGTQCLGQFGLPAQLEIGFFKIPQSMRPSWLLRFLKMEPRPGVIFCSTRNEVDRVSRLVRAFGRAVVPYHAGMSREERLIQENQIERREGLVVATSAFGMGVHYPHLEWALCYRPPSSPLALAQALGRAGRNGKQARAFVFWDDDDFRLIEWMTLQSVRRKEALQAVRSILTSMTCRRRALHSYFESDGGTPANCAHCDYCCALSI